MAIEILVASQEDMNLDLVLWRRLTRQVPGLLEATYARPANILLASYGPILPLGTKVEVDIPSTADAATAPTTVVRLWG